MMHHPDLLRRWMPFFSHCEARVDGGAWERVEGSLPWAMQEGLNTLEARGVNVCGRPGPPVRLVVAYASPRWSW